MKRECMEYEENEVPLHETLRIIDEMLEESKKLPARGGTGMYDAWYDLTDSMRQYKAAVLLTLYDSKELDKVPPKESQSLYDVKFVPDESE